jgi:hypothetical protein
MTPENKQILIELAARTAHEVNRAFCRGLHDFSHPCWDYAPAWQRSSALQGVQALLDNPHSSPADMHARWMELKLRDGWRHGPVKDESTKEHPCLVPYSDLPPEQRAKDTLFRLTVLSVLMAHGVILRSTCALP